MAQFFIRRPIVAMVIAIVTVVVGLVTLSRLPIAEYPTVSPTLIEATTTYRGAAVLRIDLHNVHIRAYIERNPKNHLAVIRAE